MATILTGIAKVDSIVGGRKLRFALLSTLKGAAEVCYPVAKGPRGKLYISDRLVHCGRVRTPDVPEVVAALASLGVLPQGDADAVTEAIRAHKARCALRAFASQFQSGARGLGIKLTKGQEAKLAEAYK